MLTSMLRQKLETHQRVVIVDHVEHPVVERSLARAAVAPTQLKVRRMEDVGQLSSRDIVIDDATFVHQREVATHRHRVQLAIDRRVEGEERADQSTVAPKHVVNMLLQLGARSVDAALLPELVRVRTAEVDLECTPCDVI